MHLLIDTAISSYLFLLVFPFLKKTRNLALYPLLFVVPAANR